MKVKVSEASGPVLDWMVAKCEGASNDTLESYIDGFKEADEGNYSTNWALGGPIIEWEGLELSVHVIHNGVITSWASEKDWNLHSATGPTPLVAAMRCFVCSKLGEEVEVPDEIN